MGAKVLDFKPNRQFINPDFNGYKLSLQEIPTVKREFEAGVYRTIPNASQYGYLHAKLFSTHNHLVGEARDNENFVYFVDNDWRIQKVIYNRSSDEEVSLVTVFEIPRIRLPQNGDFNITLNIINKNFAVLSNGMGVLYVIKTTNLQNETKWEVIFSEEVLGAEKPFVIQDAKLNNNYLYCLLYSIDSGVSNDRFMNTLSLITLTIKDGTWGQISIKELKAGGNIYYAFIEPSCDALYIAGEKSFKFTLDSDKPIEEDDIEVTSQDVYLWMQTTNDLTIKFKIPENSSATDFKIDTTSTSITCTYRDETVLSGTLYKNIDNSLTTWKLFDNVLEVILRKANMGDMWTELILGDNRGKFISDPIVAEEIHERLSHLCSNKVENPPVGTTFGSQQIEECDFDLDSYAVFERLSFTTRKITHRYNIDTHKIILILRGNDVPAIALRHDVDAYLWQPTYENEEFSLKHIGTLNAFGYVEASKQQKKFTETAPDLSYSVICESNRHVFIYRQEKSIDSGELRNRITGRHVGFIAQQQVVNIAEEIIGIYATKSKLFLLTNNVIYVFEM